MEEEKWADIRLGPLCVHHVNRVLGFRLKVANVTFFGHAQKHAYEDQPHRQPICEPHYADLVTAPTHIGQQEKFKGKAFELIKQCPNGGPIVLIGVGLGLAKGGVYGIHTAYPINLNTLQRRLRIGTVWAV
jgi:hypothetical protein